MAPRRKLCKDCLLIVAGWLRGSASCVESGEQPDDTLELNCRNDGRRTIKLAEVSDGDR